MNVITSQNQKIICKHVSEMVFFHTREKYTAISEQNSSIGINDNRKLHNKTL